MFPGHRARDHPRFRHICVEPNEDGTVDVLLTITGHSTSTVSGVVPWPGMIDDILGRFDAWYETGTAKEGEHMAINYNKYINSKSTHYIANSGSDERGQYHGGKAGDQTGKEWQLRGWYNRPWTCILRHPDPKVRRLIAELGIEGALNDMNGYDQYQRLTFWQELKTVGYRPSNITTACEQDCSAGVSAVIKATGYLLGIVELQNVSASNNSSTIREALLKAGFVEYTAAKYRTSGKYNLPGDVLLYVNHHVAINITRGAQAEGEVAESVDVPSPATYKLGDRVLKDGMTGSDVRELQSALIYLGYDCGPDGADGDFGPNTALALKAFQTVHDIDATGIADAETIAALTETTNIYSSSNAPRVTISGCSKCNIRTGPGKEYGVVGTASSGDTFEPPDPGWVPIMFQGQPRWVSGLYATKAGD